MAKVFKSVKALHPKRNPFNKSFESNLTTEFGRLTPILCEEIIPTDVFRIRTEMIIRMAPLFAPTFSRVNCYVHYWFVPRRLLFENFETAITGGENGESIITDREGNSKKVMLPFIYPDEVANFLDEADLQSLLNKWRSMFRHGTLFDYLGFPTYDADEEIGSDVFMNDFHEKVDLSPFIAYQFIFNENYRDQNFQDEIDLLKDINGNALTYLVQHTSLSDQRIADLILNLFTLRVRNWEKDYFTSALPSPQRGPETTIGENDSRIYPIDPNAHHQYSVQSNQVDVDAQSVANMLKLSSRIVASVNEFRRALSVQKFRESMARYGSRYTEFLRGIFGVRPSDSRLQRPEFLGGNRIPIQFGEILQTSQTDLTPQGTYAGRGIAGGVSPSIKAKFSEHGWLIGILSIMPKPFYMQGWPRKFSRFDKFDFFLPHFANIGEQEILQKELLYTYQGADGGNWDVADQNAKLFGYTPRYSEMRYSPSEIHGDFRTSLKDWHTARLLAPNYEEHASMLNESFLQVHPASANRIFNYRGTDYDHFWIDLYHDIKAIRPLPTYGTPTI